MHPSPPLSADQITHHLHRANAVAQRAVDTGRLPFGALLVAPDGETVLAEQGNIDTVNHAESTLVTTLEPCTMCAGTIYWADIGRVLYGAEETALLTRRGPPR